MRIYAIIDTVTGTFSPFNGKVAWSAMSALQSSFHAGQKYWAKEKQLQWKKQSRYIAVELTETYYRLEGLEG